MASNQVVLYFDKQEDAVLFTLCCQFCHVRRRNPCVAATRWSKLLRRSAKPLALDRRRPKQLISLTRAEACDPSDVFLSC